MKIDKKTVDMLMGLSDDMLWQMIRNIGGASGIEVKQPTPSPETMAGIRKALGAMTDSDIQRAVEIIENYKSGSGK